MKSIFFIILTLLIIHAAAKAAPIVGHDPISIEKATPSKNVAMPTVMSAPNHSSLNEAEYIKLKHQTDAAAALFMNDQLNIQSVEIHTEHVIQPRQLQSTPSHYRLNEGEYVTYKRLKLIM